MTGEYNHAIDAKGRLFMPAKLRDDLGEAFYVCKGLGGCLFVYSSENWENFESKVNEMPITQAIQFQRNIFPTASRCEPDAQGRILIPQKLREYAKLSKAVTVLGMGNHAEIWDAPVWDSISAEQTEETMAACMVKLQF